MHVKNDRLCGRARPAWLTLFGHHANRKHRLPNR